VQPGRAFDLTISLRSQHPPKRERYRFVLEMGNRDVRLLREEAIVPSTALTPDAEPPTVKLRVPVSRYCPAGPIPLEIACPDAKLVFAPAARGPQLDIAALPPSRETTGHLRRVNGKPVMLIDGEPVPFLVYTKCHGLTRQMARNLGQAGVHIHELSLRWGTYEPEPGVIDLSELSQRAIDTLEGDPDAHLVIKYRLDVPYWWCQRFPKECMTTYHGHVSYSQSMASDVWRREAVRLMARTVERIRRYPWSRRIVGYHIGAGKGSEFQMWGSAIDYSPAMQNAWRARLSARYGTGSALPTPAEAASSSPTLIETNARLRDLHQFLSDVNARSIAALAKGLRRLIGPDKTMGMYYGYLFEHAERVLHEGTLGIQDVVELPELQYQSAPETYYTRRVGETGAFMSPVDSMILRGKSFLLEADIRTHLWKPDVGYGRTWNTYETTQVLRRELLLALTKGVGVRWMDLADYGRDAFGDPEVLRDMRRMTEIAKTTLHETSMQPEVAIFVDAPGLAWFSHKTCRPFLQQLLSYQRSELQRMGAPYDQYLLKDLHRPDLPDYKVYVFLSPLYLSTRDRARIHEVAGRDRKTVVWFYAPGLFGDGGRAPEDIPWLTGFPVVERDEGGMAGELLPESHLIARAAARQARTFGKPMKISPLFLPDDPEATTLGRSASGAPLLALRQMPGWKSIYAATNILPAALWREIARDAGAHIYTENGEPTYAGNGVVGVHTARAGAQVITLPVDLAGASVEAPFGQSFSRDGQRIRFDTRAGETALFIVGPTGAPRTRR